MTRGAGPLEDQALVLLATSFPLQQGCASGVLKYLPDALVGLGRALEILVGTNLLADLLALLGSNRLLACLSEFCSQCQHRVCLVRPLCQDRWEHRIEDRVVLTLDGLVVVTQILLAADEDDGETLAEVQDL